MKTSYSIKNFRCFDHNGVKFEIAPITILTGANSAGKSSLVKSLIVLDSYLSNTNIISGNGRLFKTSVYVVPSNSVPLLFADGDLKLGRFDSTLNKSAKEDKNITFEYSVDSKSLGCKVYVSMTFRSDESDAMNNGWLSSVTVKDNEGEVIYHAEEIGKKLEVSTLKLSWFKARFLKAALFACITECAEWIYAENCLGVDPELGTTEESIKTHKELLEYLRIKIKDSLTEDEKMCFLSWYKASNEKVVSTKALESLCKAIEYNTLYTETDFVRSLCSLTKEDAIKRIQSIKLDSGLDTDKIERIKDFIICSLSSSECATFKEWFSMQENAALDTMHTPNVQAINLFKIKQFNIFEDGNEIDKSSTTQTKVVFEDIVTLLYMADAKFCDNALKSPIDMIGYSQTHIKSFTDYVSEVALKEVLTPDFTNALQYIGSAQVSVQRLYSNQSGNNSFTDLLLKYFNAKRNYSGVYECDSFLNKWIRKFGIGDSLTLKNAEGGLGLLALLHKTPGDAGQLLADEGYGITQLLSILLNIEVAILKAKTFQSWDGNGYRVRAARNDNGKLIYQPQTLAIEEPENHLHPKLQSLLADMFYDAYSNYNIQFILETHSEYLIRKTQVIVAQQHYVSNEEAEMKSPFRTYYLPNDGKPYSLGYRKDGKFVEEFGKGFYDEAASLMFKIL